MKQSVDRAIFLRRTNFGERDRIVTALCARGGKISLFAKGVRSPKSKLSAGIELLSISEIGFIEGKGELKTLRSAQLEEHFGNIVSDINRTSSAFNGLKIIDKQSDDGGGQEYFELLGNYLRFLSDATYDTNIVDAWFSLHLLMEGGLLGEIRALGTHEDTKNENYRFNFDEQFFEAYPTGGFSQNDIKLLRVLSKNAKPVRLQKGGEIAEKIKQFTDVLLKINIE